MVSWAFQVRVACSALAVVGAAACNVDTSLSDQYLLSGLTTEPKWSEWNATGENEALGIVERIGMSEGDLMFGRVQAVATDGSGRMAVYDRSVCEVTVLSPERRIESRFGRCGSAPGESLEVARMELRGDTLVKFDLVSSTISWVTLDGVELRRVRLNSPARGGPVVIAVRNDSSVVAGMNTNARNTDGTRAHLLSVFDSRTGELVEGRLTAGEAALQASAGSNETLTVCTSNASSPYIVATQQWLLQAIVLDLTSLRAVSNHVTLSEKAGGTYPSLPGGRKGAYQPKLGAVGAVCGPNWYAMSARPVDWTVYPAKLESSLLEIRRYDGSILYRGTNPPSVHPMARPRAAWGNNLVFVSNEDIPQIVVVRVGAENQ